jgi:hypothetical protein
MNIYLILLTIAVILNLVWLSLVTVSLFKSRRAQNSIFRGLEDEDVSLALEKFVSSLKGVTGTTEQLAQKAQRHENLISGCVQKVGVLRFDAFNDTGGQLSFSVAFLDDEGSGVVLTTINGRNESRSYAKKITKGKSNHVLTEEEEKAITSAMTGRPARPLGGDRK